MGEFEKSGKNEIHTNFLIFAKVLLNFHIAPHGIKILSLRQRPTEAEIGWLGKVDQQPGMEGITVKWGNSGQSLFLDYL